MPDAEPETQGANSQKQDTGRRRDPLEPGTEVLANRHEMLALLPGCGVFGKRLGRLPVLPEKPPVGFPA